MAVKNVVILIGQSNAEVPGTDRADLPGALRGPQANAEIWNHENNAVETLDVDGVGANLPNNTTTHTAPWFGPEMQLSSRYVAALGSVLIFKYAVGDTTMGPHASKSTWNVEDADLFTNFKTRFNAMVAAVTGGGDTVSVVDIYWVQGESDAGIEGHDEAYLGLYKRFIKEVRAHVSTYLASTAKWVAGLINSLVGSTSLTRLENIRGALRRAGWSDPAYRVADLRGLAYQINDPVHLASQGAIDLGDKLYDAAQLQENNSMALEEYTLKSIADKLINEFGIEDTAANRAIVNEKINLAKDFIITRRPNWPFMERNIAINVGLTSAVVDPKRYGAAVFTLAQTLAESITGGVAAREFINLSNDAASRDAILINDVTGGNAILEKQFLGDAAVVSGGFTAGANPTVITLTTTTSTQGNTVVIPKNVATFPVKLAGWALLPGPAFADGIYTATRIDDTSFSVPIDTSVTGASGGAGAVQLGREFLIQQGLFALPDDFVRMSSVSLDSSIDRAVKYVNPHVFARLIKATRAEQPVDPIYTVVADPLHLDDKKYLWIFPYFSEREVLHIKYWGTSRKLVADGDTPEIPIENRTSLFYFAGWFVASWQKDVEMIQFYRDQALMLLEDMLAEYDLADDITESSQRLESDAAEFIRGPAGFPRFEMG